MPDSITWPRPLIAVCCACWLWSIGRIALADSPARQDSATDWPSTIARLRQEMYERPGVGSIRQQLATAYNNYGVSLGQQHDWAGAVSQLQEAVRLDQANEPFRKNLSYLYLNEAADVRAHQRLSEALELIQNALDARPDFPEAYALRGEIEYQRQHLKEAKAAWQQALKLDPAQPEVAKRLSQVTEELPIESKFGRLSQAYFDIRYEEKIKQPIDFNIRDALLDARRAIGADFASWPKHKIVVLVYSIESFRALRKETPEWVAGQFDGKIRVPIPSGEVHQATVRQILFHEYTHAVIQDLTVGHCPVWLNEGLAEYEGHTQEKGTLKQLKAVQAAQRLISWGELSDHFSVSASADDVALAYEEAHAIAAYLVTRYGWWRMRKIISGLQAGQDWRQVFSNQLHVKLPKLESEWRQQLPEWIGANQ